MTTALYFLRSKQLGLTIDDMEQIDEGFVLDMMTEKANDQHTYKELATQNDFDKF